MKAIKTILVLLLISIPAFSCSGDDGKDGINGATGGANVIYSAWLTAPTAVTETIDETFGMSTTINAPELSEDILAKGSILLYVSFDPEVHTIPYTSTAGGAVNTITAIASVKKIKLFRFRHTGEGTINLPKTLKWRYIFIPEGIAASTGKTAKVNYSYMNYQEVCAHFNIAQ